jgi:hypothetical protein
VFKYVCVRVYIYLYIHNLLQLLCFIILSTFVMSTQQTICLEKKNLPDKDRISKTGSQRQDLKDRISYLPHNRGEVHLDSVLDVA